MNHRHLLPNEIDLLVDGEGGFGIAPLQAHVRECGECRRELHEAQQVAAMLEELPRFAPSHGLADRVMAKVPVFVPWHVAARDTVREWMPAARPFRMLALAGATTMAVLLTLTTLWIAARGDMIAFASAAAGDQLRVAVLAGARELATALLGEQVFAALAQTGPIGLALAIGGFVAAALMALAGLRAVAAGARGRS